eukprot:6102924-Pyramimonas_sp.AAC.1
MFPYSACQLMPLGWVRRRSTVVASLLLLLPPPPPPALSSPTIGAAICETAATFEGCWWVQR